MSTPRTSIGLKDINWPQSIFLLGTPILALYGITTTPLVFKTAIFTIIYYFITGFGITGVDSHFPVFVFCVLGGGTATGNKERSYHRYWSHRSYDASRAFQYFLMLAASGSVEGSIRWWCRDHRAHHRFTDTSKDPYSAHLGLFWAHMGWMLVKQDKDAIGKVDISDLNRDPMIRWQHKNYVAISMFMAFVFPTLVCGLLWGDWFGGYFYAGVLRLVFVHHATFCVNSLAHYLGEHSYDDKHTPRDHFITALVTLGEGYHNFHHEFPSDYRNAIIWYQYDPTKWIIFLCSFVGLTKNLKTFPSNEITKGRIQMQQKKIDEIKAKLDWGVPLETLPKMSFEQVKAETKETGRALVIISDVVYDVTKFMDDHPGGRGFLSTSIGRDMSASFNGGIYNHSSAARNLMASMRYAVLSGSVPESEKAKEE
ncbi:hypothetical protein HDU76_002064 [Blyttiomyces sp. JEL0837]|nr:hypothetical protein HDU76_002064 [Blyttiomyces sp. JEL0837]